MTSPVPASEFSRNFGRYQDQAMTGGVVRVSSHGRIAGGFLSPAELDRYERLTLANRIYSRMLELKYRMDAMIMLCQYSSWSDVLFAIDPETWAAYFTASQAVNDIIDNWNTLGI